MLGNASERSSIKRRKQNESISNNQSKLMPEGEEFINLSRLSEISKPGKDIDGDKFEVPKEIKAAFPSRVNISGSSSRRSKIPFAKSN